MSKQLTGSTGQPIVLHCADIEIVEELIQLIVRKAGELNLESIIQTFSSLDMNDVLNLDLETLLPLLPLLQQIVCQLEGSKEFKNIIYALLRNCTYNNTLITPQLFNDKPELREDYYMLEWEVVKFNLAPFLKRLSGKFFQIVPKQTN